MNKIIYTYFIISIIHNFEKQLKIKDKNFELSNSNDLYQ